MRTCKLSKLRKKSQSVDNLWFPHDGTKRIYFQVYYEII